MTTLRLSDELLEYYAERWLAEFHRFFLTFIEYVIWAEKRR